MVPWIKYEEFLGHLHDC